MKVVVFLSQPEFLDVTIHELEQAWLKLKEIDGVDLQIIKFHGQSTFGEKAKYISDAEAVLGLWIADNVIDETFLNQHPNLKYISTLAHGFGYFDAEITRKKGVTITNTIYGDVTIAEYAMALLLDVCHNIEIHSQYLKNRYWEDYEANKKFDKIFTRQIELYNKTIGIWGLGNIGLKLAKMAKGFGMHVLGYSRNIKKGSEYDDIEQVALDELLERSDVISLHTPLTNSTKHMINKEVISKMKDGVILINTARGKLIVEDDLVEALNSGKIYAAGLDVLSEEPPINRIPLMNCYNAKITGHIAWVPRESRLRAIEIAIDNFKAYIQGHPKSVIN